MKGLLQACCLCGALAVAGCASLDDRYAFPLYDLQGAGEAGAGWSTADLCGVLLATAGCEDRYGVAGGAPADAGRILAAVDWSRAERVTIRLSDFEFAPETLTFTAGRPYTLVLENDGSSGHTFTAETFFRAIALHDITPAAAAPPPGVLESAAVQGGQQRTLRFVPVVAGTYGLTCERPLHDLFGMNGTIRIE